MLVVSGCGSSIDSIDCFQFTGGAGAVLTESSQAAFIPVQLGDTYRSVGPYLDCNRRPVYAGLQGHSL